MTATVHPDIDAHVRWCWEIGAAERGTVTPEMFGAVSDDVVKHPDDTAAIQAAIDFAMRA